MVNSGGCRCESGLRQRVYPITTSNCKKISTGRVVACLDAEDDDRVTKYALSLILYGECENRKVNRFLGYDTAHDDYHLENYGGCHRHTCETCIPYSPCDYAIVASIFFSEIDDELVQRGFIRV